MTTGGGRGDSYYFYVKAENSISIYWSPAAPAHCSRSFSWLEGVEQQLEVPPPNTANLFSETDGMSAKQMAAHGVGRLPQNLAEAVAVTDTPCAPESISPSASPMVMVMVMVMRPSSQAVCLCLCLLPRSLAPPSRLCGVLIADGRRGHGASDG